MREQGIVTSVDGKFAKVKINKKTECDKCGMCLFPQGASSTEFNAINKIKANVGDKVTIETEKDAKFMGALLVFLVPLLLIALSAVIGIVLLNNELHVLLLSAVFIAVWFFVLSVIDKKLKKSSAFSPVIISVEQTAVQTAQE